MMNRLRQAVPASWLGAYHLVLSYLAAAWYGFPSEKLVIVGVTGTNGKTTTAYFTAKALEAAGDQTGCTTTALFKVGTKEWLNDTKMTMLGRFQLQKLLRDMVKAGCRYAVIETSSQGIAQHRHRAINYDVAIFTNLTPEHVEAHGSFEKYKDAKVELFRHMAKSKRKIFGGKTVPKIAVVNLASEHAKDFAVAGLDKVVWYGIGAGDMSAKDLEDKGWSTSFTVDGHRTTVNMPGEVNVENALAAIATATSLGLSLEAVLQKIDSVSGVPGRFERINEGQPYTVIVDYAVEPAAMEKLYAAIDKLPHARVIHVLGSCGGGRDVARRPILGKMAAEHADEVIVTNEDPYDDDPQQIVDHVAQGAKDAGISPDALKEVLDRKEAIFAAMKDAKPGDLVLLTGKGCEQAIVGPSRSKTPWDEREVAREAIKATRSAMS
ncbi:MAG: UDP-N-acetylmuramoyl-L-alanyl-D-glutamate--2,6-diaminopimelate ligase [Patescibacteria group bacterium]